MQTFEEINSLIQLDIDAVEAYKQALRNIDFPSIYSSLEGFRQDHEEHIRALSAEIHQLGGKPIERSQDFKGYLIEGFTAIRSVTGVEGALKAMLGNEKLTTQTYEKALDADVPVSTKNIIRKNYEDEERHLKYIENALDLKSWGKK